MNKFMLYVFIYAVVFQFGNTLQAEQTNIDVRVLSHDAKFIGDKTGRTQIKIIDLSTNEILASGTTVGGTGDTKRIMKTPQTRNFSLATEGAASYRAKIDLKKATKVRITASGPLDLGNRALTTSTDLWLIPGKHMVSNGGILLKLSGFLVDAQLKEQNGEAKITAEITMLCGCPIEPDGLWDAKQYEITAQIWKSEDKIQEIPLKFHETSIFKGSFEKLAPGSYTVGIVAYDPVSLNTGYQELPLEIKGN